MKSNITVEQLSNLSPVEIGKFTEMFGGYSIISKYSPNENIYMDKYRYGYNSDDICKLFNVGNMIEYIYEKYERVDIRCETVSTVVIFDSVKYDFDYYKYREVDISLTDALFKIICKSLKED